LLGVIEKTQHYKAVMTANWLIHDCIATEWWRWTGVWTCAQKSPHKAGLYM